jgi:hypothetical protein
MKTVKCASLYGVFIVTLFCASSSCKKSSNSSSNSNSSNVSFQWSGQTTVMTGILDTVHDFNFIGSGFLPGSTDTTQFNIVIPNLLVVPTFTLTGLYSDTAANYDQTATFSLVDPISGLAYQDNTSSLHPFSLTVSANNGHSLTATFTGMVYRTNGTGADSLMISNGHLTINY